MRQAQLRPADERRPYAASTRLRFFVGDACATTLPRTAGSATMSQERTTDGTVEVRQGRRALPFGIIKQSLIVEGRARRPCRAASVCGPCSDADRCNAQNPQFRDSPLDQAQAPSYCPSEGASERGILAHEPGSVYR